MHPITVVSVVAFSFAAERVITLFFRFNIDAERLWAQLEKLVLDNNVERALNDAMAADRCAAQLRSGFPGSPEIAQLEAQQSR